MFEIILLLVVGSIVYSFYQSLRRGKVIPEQREKNPTLIESLADAATAASQQSSRFLAQTRFELKHFEWFRVFEQITSSTLETLERLAAVESRLAGNPKLREMYDKVSAETDVLRKTTAGQLAESGPKTEPGPAAEPDWVKDGPPTRPQPGPDPEMTRIYQESFDRRIKQHRKFVDEIQERLRRKPQLRKTFEDSMIKIGLKGLLQNYFPNTEPVKLSPAATNLLVAQPRQVHGQFSNDGLVKNFVVETKRTRVLVSKPRPALNEIDAINRGASGTVPSAGSIRPAGPSGGSKNIMLSSMNRGKEADDAEKHAQFEVERKARDDRELEIRVLADERGIPSLVHFTRCENLPSILRYGLLSTANCDTQGIQGVRNDRMRLDGQPNGISTSVTFPNYRMFYKYRQMDTLADWAVLILSPSILWKKRCGFYKYNAADSRMRNLPLVKMATGLAFQEMFESSDAPREAWLRRYDPSDAQAEVMVYEMIEPRFIEAIAFETGPVAEKWEHVLGGIDGIHAGQGNGLFGTRRKVRLETDPAMRAAESQIQGPGKPQITRGVAPVARRSQIAEKDQRLLSELEVMRRALARAAGFPPYTIVSDQTLIGMAQNRPKSSEELAQIGGFGTKKLSNYGAAFLWVIAKHL